MKLAHRVALITGGGSGLGQAAARLFAAEGAKIVIADIDRESGEATAAAIRRQGGDSLFVQTDITQASDNREMVKQAVENWGRIDILVASAGIFRLGSPTEMSERDWDRTIDINLKGVFLSAKYCIPEMIKVGGGNVITLGSAAGLDTPVHGNVAYGSSKAAVVYLTKLIALEYGVHGIRANCVCPGNIDTPMFRHSVEHDMPDPEKELKAVVSKTVLKRLGTAEEVAHAMLYLVSDAASYITGSVLVIDGGRLLMLATE